MCPFVGAREDRGEDHLRCLTERRGVEVVAGEQHRSPVAQVGVEFRGDVGRGRSHLGEAHRGHPRISEAAADPTESIDGRQRGGRRADQCPEQVASRDAPAVPGYEELADRPEVVAVEPEVFLERPTDVVEKRLQVLGQVGVVEGREFDRTERQVLFDESWAGLGMPLGDDRRGRRVLEVAPCGPGPAAELGVEPEGDLEEEGRGRLRRGLVGPDEGTHPRVGEPVHEPERERLCRHAEKRPLLPVRRLHGLGYQPPHDRRGAAREVRAVQLPEPRTRCLEGVACFCSHDRHRRTEGVRRHQPRPVASADLSAGGSGRLRSSTRGGEA